MEDLDVANSCLTFLASSVVPITSMYFSSPLKWNDTAVFPKDLAIRWKPFEYPFSNISSVRITRYVSLRDRIFRRCWSTSEISWKYVWSPITRSCLWQNCDLSRSLMITASYLRAISMRYRRPSRVAKWSCHKGSRPCMMILPARKASTAPVARVSAVKSSPQNESV